MIPKVYFEHLFREESPGSCGAEMPAVIVSGEQISLSRSVTPNGGDES